MDHSPHQTPETVDGKISRAKWVLLAFIALAAYFLITEHRAHIYQYLPFLLLLACPLMHLFHGHGGHGGHRGKAVQEGKTPDGAKAEDEKKHGGGCH